MKNIIIAVSVILAGLALVVFGLTDRPSSVSMKVVETTSLPESSETTAAKNPNSVEAVAATPSDIKAADASKFVETIIEPVSVVAVQSESEVIAAVDPGLPQGYWSKPKATYGNAPHEWSALESNLHPEACAQCHREQFDVWKKSLHAHAYSSGLVGQFPGMGHVGGNDCLQCHAPLAEQLYPDSNEMMESVRLRLQHAQGFNADAVLEPESQLPLRHTGVSCAVCHVRGWKRFGPPPKSSGAVGFQDTAVHGGFTASKAFEDSQFCASCHQFPQSAAINGKPLENTVFEWKQSDFSRQGISCQQCHMPDRKHEFRGIHDSEMVRKGLEIKLSRQGESAVLSMTSTWVGHAFPTYVTPKVIILAEAENRDGKVVERWVWEIVREVGFNDGWKEIQDTRLMPGETRNFVADKIPAEAVSIRYKVSVIPDFFYKGVYQNLLSGNLSTVAREHLKKAASHADNNDYLLYEEKLTL